MGARTQAQKQTNCKFSTPLLARAKPSTKYQSWMFPHRHRKQSQISNACRDRTHPVRSKNEPHNVRSGNGVQETEDVGNGVSKTGCGKRDAGPKNLGVEPRQLDRLTAWLRPLHPDPDWGQGHPTQHHGLPQNILMLPDIKTHPAPSPSLHDPARCPLSHLDAQSSKLRAKRGAQHLPALSPTVPAPRFQ